MNETNKPSAYRTLVLITTPLLAQKASKMFEEADIPVNYRISAMGTASSEMLDILGLGSSDKMLIMSVMPKECASDLLHKLKRELKIGAVNSGIAFTMQVTSASSIILKMLGSITQNNDDTTVRKEQNNMSENKYCLISAIVNQGFSEEVADVARKAGASGGTVLHSRRAGNEETISMWGLGVNAEREIILIVASAENKLEIMQAIGASCGVSSEANGVVMSMPIDEVIGLND